MFRGSSINPIDSFDIAEQIGSIILAIAVPKDSPIQNTQDLVDAARPINYVMKLVVNLRKLVGLTACFEE